MDEGVKISKSNICPNVLDMTDRYTFHIHLNCPTLYFRAGEPEPGDFGSLEPSQLRKKQEPELL